MKKNYLGNGGNRYVLVVRSYWGLYEGIVVLYGIV